MSCAANTSRWAVEYRVKITDRWSQPFRRKAWARLYSACGCPIQFRLYDRETGEPETGVGWVAWNPSTRGVE